MANQTADFTPTRGQYTELKPFRYWCQKVLPLVYDDSLSYYELLSKVLDFLNKAMEDTEVLNDDVGNLFTAYNELQDYVNHYYDTLDVQDEINNKLDGLVADGTMDAIVGAVLPNVVGAQIGGVVASQIDGVVGEQIGGTVSNQIGGVVGEQIAPVVSSWLRSNMTNPSNPAIDGTLLVDGAAADASATGEIDGELASKIGLTRITSWQYDKYRPTVGFDTLQGLGDSTSWKTTLLNCSEGDKFTCWGMGGINTASFWAFYDANDVKISESGLNVVMSGETITAPANSAKVVFNVANGWTNVYKGEALTDIRDYINEIFENIISSGGVFPSIFFANGDINSSGAYVQSVRYRVCTPKMFTVKNDMVVTIDSGYILSLWLYPNGESPTVQHGSGFIIPHDVNARIAIRKVPEDTSIIADVKEFSSAVFLKINEFEAHKINNLSYGIVDERYNHIVYDDLLSDLPTIDRRSAGGVYIDYDVRFHGRAYSIRMLTANGGSITTSEIRFTLPRAINLAGTQELVMFVYIPDATGITNFSLRTMTGGFVKSNYPSTIVNGWNKFRFFTEGAGNIDITADITTFRLIVAHDANTEANIYIGDIVQVKPEFGNIIIVDDGPYKTFYDIAYPLFKALNVPVTWAIDPELLGDNTDPNRQNVSQEEIDVLAFDGLSEFSFHNYDGTIMSTATEAEALKDTLNCIRYLRKNGLEPEKIFRASWLQNNCPNHALADLVLDASATYNGASGITMYPFPDKYNIARYSMQGRQTSAIDAIFNKLKTQHCTVFMYTHGISDGSDRNLTESLLQYYVNKISEGITEGWLNPTTYNRLVSLYSKID